MVAIVVVVARIHHWVASGNMIVVARIHHWAASVDMIVVAEIHHWAAFVGMFAVAVAIVGTPVPVMRSHVWIVPV